MEICSVKSSTCWRHDARKCKASQLRPRRSLRFTAQCNVPTCRTRRGCEPLLSCGLCIVLQCDFAVLDCVAADKRTALQPVDKLLRRRVHLVDVYVGFDFKWYGHTIALRICVPIGYRC